MATHCFTRKEVEYLAGSINVTLGIEVKIRTESRKNSNKKEYYIEISTHENVGKFFEYLEQAKSINEAKETVPHKFETKWSPRTPEMKQHRYLYLPDVVEETGLSHLSAIRKNKKLIITQTEKMVSVGKYAAYIVRTFGVDREAVYRLIKGLESST